MNGKSLDILFEEAFENANLIPKESVPIDTQLVLYGLYKLVTYSTNSPRLRQNPQDLRDAFKLNALLQVRHLNASEAKEQYIEIINKLMKERNLR